MKALVLLVIYSTLAWAQQPGQKPAAQIIYGASLPATCNPALGQIFFKTTATVGPSYCDDTNHWTAMSGGGGGGTPASPFGSVAFNNGGAFGGDGSYIFSPTAPTAPAAPTLSGAGSIGGATTRSYRIAGCLVGSNPCVLQVHSVDATTATGQAVLNGGTPLTVTAPSCTGTPYQSFDVYQTGPTFGLIGNVACGGAFNDTGQVAVYPFLGFPDNGAVAIGTTQPIVSNSGYSGFGDLAGWFVLNQDFPTSAGGMGVYSSSSFIQSNFSFATPAFIGYITDGGSSQVNDAILGYADVQSVNVTGVQPPVSSIVNIVAADPAVVAYGHGSVINTRLDLGPSSQFYDFTVGSGAI